MPARSVDDLRGGAAGGRGGRRVRDGDLDVAALVDRGPGDGLDRLAAGLASVERAGERGAAAGGGVHGRGGIVADALRHEDAALAGRDGDLVGGGADVLPVERERRAYLGDVGGGDGFGAGRLLVVGAGLLYGRRRAVDRLWSVGCDGDSGAADGEQGGESGADRRLAARLGLRQEVADLFDWVVLHGMVLSRYMPVRFFVWPVPSGAVLAHRGIFREHGGAVAVRRRRRHGVVLLRFRVSAAG